MDLLLSPTKKIVLKIKLGKLTVSNPHKPLEVDFSKVYLTVNLTNNYFSEISSGGVKE